MQLRVLSFLRVRGERAGGVARSIITRCWATEMVGDAAEGDDPEPVVPGVAVMGFHYEVRELTRMGVLLAVIVWCPPGERRSSASRLCPSGCRCCARLWTPICAARTDPESDRRMAAVTPGQRESHRRREASFLLMITGRPPPTSLSSFRTVSHLPSLRWPCYKSPGHSCGLRQPAVAGTSHPGVAAGDRADVGGCRCEQVGDRGPARRLRVDGVALLVAQMTGSYGDAISLR